MFGYIHFKAFVFLQLGPERHRSIDAFQFPPGEWSEGTLETMKLAGAEKDPGSPCPYCGQLLRTPRAKQCRARGMDWHDADNAVSRKTGSVD